MMEFDFSSATVLFTDVDDTLTTEGRLLPETYQALCDLADAGVDIIPVTGGCAGWCDQMVRTWPVKAVIGEGGAFYVTFSEGRSMVTRFWHTEEEHRRDQQAIVNAIQTLDVGFPINLANDQPYRRVDVAIDYNQDHRLDRDEVDQVTQALLELGFNVRMSSIHLNVWRGPFDKCAMAVRLGRELLGLEPDALKQHAVFVGDAPNDESMFRFFPQSVGVANIHRHLEQMTHRPGSITRQPSGLGFAELVRQWLKQRTPSIPDHQP
ncbi:HAD-IIB family hydrolase [Saccharospirillum salsuginis]|uniref:Haloacid dehalogenase n=1 Tax=Saccharospirillum salsuginis TaxID=418750 RepID=A0A918KGV4_9GAMM|nr:HAD-IIB family hydrolase [Saccharospirillum salsuginis]GGX62787.1 haloacid dehalogenase [Saccharospirillum salsuginis]